MKPKACEFVLGGTSNLPSSNFQKSETQLYLLCHNFICIVCYTMRASHGPSYDCCLVQPPIPKVSLVLIRYLPLISRLKEYVQMEIISMRVHIISFQQAIQNFWGTTTSPLCPSNQPKFKTANRIYITAPSCVSRLYLVST